MRCVGTDLKFHWVRHDEGDAEASASFVGDATSADGRAGGGSGGGAGGGGGGEGDAKSAQQRRATISDRTMLKRKVGWGGVRCKRYMTLRDAFCGAMERGEGGGWREGFVRVARRVRRDGYGYGCRTNTFHLSHRNGGRELRERLCKGWRGAGAGLWLLFFCFYFILLIVVVVAYPSFLAFLVSG